MIGFGERGLKDPRYYASCLKFLMHTIEQTSSKYYKRLDMDHQIIVEATDIFKKIFFFPKLDSFDDVGSSFFQFIYKMSQQPDTVSQTILIELSQKVLQISDKMKSNDAESQSVDSNRTLKVPVFLLARMIFCYGLVVMNEVSFLDIDVYNNMKYRQELMEEKKSQNNKNQSKRLSRLNTSARDALKRLSDSAAEPQQEVNLFSLLNTQALSHNFNIFIFEFVARRNVNWSIGRGLHSRTNHIGLRRRIIVLDTWNAEEICPGYH